MCSVKSIWELAIAPSVFFSLNLITWQFIIKKLYQLLNSPNLSLILILFLIFVIIYRDSNISGRSSDEHSRQHGEWSVRHRGPTDVYQSGRDWPEPGVAGSRPGPNCPRPESQFARKPVSNVWWSMGGTTLPTARHWFSRSSWISYKYSH